MDFTQQGIQSAAPQLDELKNKAGQMAGGGSGDATMPDFKPNTQKTKNFLKRLEYGANVQSVKSNAFFPTTSDLAATLGYKLNSKSTSGRIYKPSWGRDLQHIHLSSQGLGLRSFLDMGVPGKKGLPHLDRMEGPKTMADLSPVVNNEAIPASNRACQGISLQMTRTCIGALDIIFL